MAGRFQTFSVLVLVAVCAALSSCTSPELKMSDGPVPMEKVFYAPYEDLERALKQAMIKYPQKVDNTEEGIFETDYVRGDLRFKPPQKKVSYSNGYRYRILVRLVKGKSLGQGAVKLIVTKEAEIARDFFSEPEQLGTDGLEEKVILYRVGRELAIDRAIRKTQGSDTSRQ